MPVGGPARTAASALSAATGAADVDGVDLYDTARRVVDAFSPAHGCSSAGQTRPPTAS